MENENAKVFAALAAITGEIKPISKDKQSQQGYKFRGIDDVYAVLQKLLAKYQVVIVPRVASVEESQHQTAKGGIMWRVRLQMDYDIFGPDGSKVTARIPAEAMDTSDKATNKALSFAFKYLCFELFCIPVEGVVDGDAESPEAAAPKPPPKETPAEMAERRAGMISALQEKLGSATDTVILYLQSGLPKPWLKEGQSFGALTDARLKHALDGADALADNALKWKENLSHE